MTDHCPACEDEVEVERDFRGSYAALIVLLIIGIAPGLLYYVIRRERVCQACGNIV